MDVGRQATHGCGDLIFSSHTTFVLTGVLTFTEYGETLVIKVLVVLTVLTRAAAAARVPRGAACSLRLFARWPHGAPCVPALPTNN